MLGDKAKREVAHTKTISCISASPGQGKLWWPRQMALTVAAWLHWRLMRPRAFLQEVAWPGGGPSRSWDVGARCAQATTTPDCGSQAYGRLVAVVGDRVAGVAASSKASLSLTKWTSLKAASRLAGRRVPAIALASCLWPVRHLLLEAPLLSHVAERHAESLEISVSLLYVVAASGVLSPAACQPCLVIHRRRMPTVAAGLLGHGLPCARSRAARKA